MGERPDDSGPLAALIKRLASLTHLFQRPASHDAVRAEIFFLGGRHQGEPLAGAMQELKAPGLGADRARLLRAVVARLTRPPEPA